MATVLAKVERLCAIHQAIKAGSDFAGLTPKDGGPLVALVPTFADDIFEFAPGLEGGLFDPTDDTLYAFEPKDALRVVAIELALGGNQSTWKVELKDINDNLVELFSGTTEVSFVTSDTTQIHLPILWGSKILVTTTGGVDAMTAKLKFEPHVIGH